MNNSINDFNLNENIIKALEKHSISEFTPIQVETIPLLLQGYDVIGQAQTGTGKTFAYSIPLIESLINNKKGCALVLLPTRELAIQVSNEIRKLSDDRSLLRIATIYGGASYEKQFKELRLNPNVIVGTPGRLVDQIERGKLNLSNLSYLVFDEADEMLKMGFEADLEKILNNAPKERQTALFSATLPPFVMKVSKNYMQDPKYVKIESKTLTATNITEKVYYVMRESKKDLLIRLLDYYDFSSVMIFANTKAMVDELTLFLRKEGYKADGLHGDLKQAERDKVMTSFRTSHINILIATDVASRGIDINDISAVINYDVPDENELYVHRIGRTARMDKEGVSLTFATSKTKGRISDIEKYTKRSMKLGTIPTEEEIRSSLLKKLYDKIIQKSDLNSNNHEYDELLRMLSQRNSDPMPLLRGLLAMLEIKRHEYNNIQVLELKKKKDNKNNNFYDKVSKKSNRKKDSFNEYYLYSLSVCKKDKISANRIINGFHDDLKIHREHFGKINITNNETLFEIKEEGAKFLRLKGRCKINNKFYNYRKVAKVK